MTAYCRVVGTGMTRKNQYELVESLLRPRGDTRHGSPTTLDTKTIRRDTAGSTTVFMVAGITVV